MEENTTMSMGEATETTGAETSADSYWPEDIDDIISEANATVEDTDDGESDGETAEAAQTKDAEGEADTDAEGDTSDKQEPDKFVLKHLDDTHEVNRDEVIALAQKGLDYDRIRERLAAADTELAELRNKRAELDTATAELDELKNWLVDVAGGMNLADFRDTVDARRLAARENIDEKTALGRVKLARERKALEAERQRIAGDNDRQAKANAEHERQRADVAAFVKAFPDVANRAASDKTVIPAEVWEAVNKGETLVNAYTAYAAKKDAEAKDKRIKELESALETEKQAKKNAARSTGSQKSDGGEAPYDPIAAGWNSV